MTLPTVNELVRDITFSLGCASKKELWENCRSPDLDVRYTYRNAAYESVLCTILSLRSLGNLKQNEKYVASDINPEIIYDCLQFLKPILTGALGEGRVDSQQLYEKLAVAGDLLASVLFKEQFLLGRFINLLSATYGLCLPTADTLIEAVDPEHRPAAMLFRKLTLWGGNAGKDFFKSLPPASSNGGVKYLLTEAEREPYKAYFEAGKIFINGKVLDTSQAKGKQDGFYSYAISTDNILYTAPHVKGIFQHSTFFACGPAQCFGMIKVEKGKLVDISNHSGHYRPKIQVYLEALRAIPPSTFIRKTPIYPSGASIRGERTHRAKFIDQCKSSHSKLFRFLGRATQTKLIYTSYRDVTTPIPIIRRIGSLIVLAAANNLEAHVARFVDEYQISVHNTFAKDLICHLLNTLSDPADKLFSLEIMPAFLGVVYGLHGEINKDNFNKKQKEILLFLNEKHFDVLATTVKRMAKDNIIIHFFDEKKRENYRLDSFSKIKAEDIYPLLRGTEEEKIKTLEEACYSVLFYPDFDASYHQLNSCYFENVKFSGFQIKEMSLIKKIYNHIVKQNPVLNDSEFSRLLLNEFTKPSHIEIASNDTTDSEIQLHLLTPAFL